MKKILLTLMLLPVASFADMNDEPVLFALNAHELEYRRDGGASAVAWDVAAWVGTTRDRFMLRSEGEADDDETEAFDTTAVWSRAVSPYWNVNLGWRGDWQPERRRNWAAVELEGLAPGFIETRVSLLAGSGGRWSARLLLETKWRLTQRLELVPLLESDWYREADPLNGIGAGLRGVEAGLRLKYRIRPNLKPYVGFSWTRLTGDTADLARAAGQQAGSSQVLAGVSLLF